jgi:hypothetical protein
MRSPRDTPCPLCSKTFRGPQGLESHIGHKHPVEGSGVSDANSVTSKASKKSKQSRYLQGRVFTRGPSKAMVTEMQKLPKCKYKAKVSTLTPDEMSMVEGLRRTEYVKHNIWVTFFQGGAAGTK